MCAHCEFEQSSDLHELFVLDLVWRKEGQDGILGRNGFDLVHQYRDHECRLGNGLDLNGDEGERGCQLQSLGFSRLQFSPGSISGKM